MQEKNTKLDSSFIWGEKIIYILISVLLFVTALFLVVNSAVMLVVALSSHDYIQGALHVIDRVLLALMVVEIMYTVKVSLQSHTLQAEPFFIVGLIASIRRILIISVESAYLPERFTHHMIEMGVLGGIIIIFLVGILLCKKRYC
jgi:uncharacterized membrane protein YeiB